MKLDEIRRKKGDHQDQSSSRPLERGAVLLIGLLFLIVLAVGCIGRGVRVGDGSEYYVMFYAWRDTTLPYVTARAWDGYVELLNSGSVLHLMPLDFMKQVHPSLYVGETRDFNHFWFYSLSAAILSKIFGFIPVFNDAQNSFALLHAFLAGGLAFVAWKLRGFPGIFAVYILLFVSPSLWFLDKVHTEFFTISLTSMAVLLALHGRYLFASIALAIASTQNPSFAVPAGALVLLDLFENGLFKNKAKRVLLVLISSVLVLLHPVYYLTRYGVITPQAHAGGVEFSWGDLIESHIWFIDPDVGLLPNWPLGIATLILGCVIAIRYGRVSVSWKFLIFSFAYLAISLIAQAATSNINHGATVSVSRYSLWYLCFFLPLLILLVEALADIEKPLIKRGLAAILLILALPTLSTFQPGAQESQGIPTWLSIQVQRNAPGLYTPPLEVFAERFSGVDGVLDTSVGAVVGPGCRKVAYRADAPTPWTVTNKYCDLALQAEDLRSFLTNRFGNVGPKWQLVALEPDELAGVTARPPINQAVNASTGDLLTIFLGNGWSALESWGVWSEAKRASMVLPIDPRQLPANLNLELQSFVPAGTDPLEVRIEIEDGDSVDLRFTVEEPRKAVRLQLRPDDIDDDVIVVRFSIDNPRSPSELGLSIDGRKLGIGLISFMISR